MWEIAGIKANPELAAPAQALLQSTTRTIILSVGCVYLACHIMLTVSWPDLYRWSAWLVLLIVALTCITAWTLVVRRLAVAQILWLSGMTVAITAGLAIFQQPQIAFLYALLPLLVVVLIGWRTGLATVVALAALVWWIQSSAVAPLDRLDMLLIGVGGAFTWLLGWACTHTLSTATQWSLFSYNQAQQHLSETQQQRARLEQMVKDLDHAYYRLERANAALVAARNIAEEAERFKAEFVTNISHELRTPLNLIIGYSEVMMTAPQSYNNVQLPGAYRRDLNAVYRSAQHLLALVDDVLDLARIEAGKIALVREEIDLAALVTDAAETMRDYITAKGLELQIHTAADLPRLWIDRLRIRQVLLNLLVNAARFTEQGRIRVEALRDGDEIVVRVRDTGRGIDAHDLAKMFEAFRTTAQPTSTWHSGAGLGLPISKKFIELHHGVMGVESEIGRGTTFWFTLPCALHTTSRLQHTTTQRWAPRVHLGASERIIVVTHADPQVAPLLRRHLDGYQIVGFADAAEGASFAETMQAIALVTDAATALPTTITVPIIRCPLPSGRQTAIALGVADLLVKPVSREQLLDAITNVAPQARRLLLVDDDADMVRLYQRMLATCNPAPECLFAYNGAEALDVLRREPIDLMLLDLAMPELDGRGVLEHMAEASGRTDLPVIIISAHENDYAHMLLSGVIEISRHDGFRLGDMLRTLDALFNALGPGWRQLAHIEPTPATALPG
jgi:signal transduction histidine kinase/CheY-like chemotaxis protein